jgi:hypothetical protein
MKRGLLSLVVLGGIAALAASPAAAQTRLSLGVGGVVPSGDYSTIDNTGWHLMGALELGLRHLPISARADVVYGQTSHQTGLLTGSTKLTGATANAVYHLGGKMLPVRLYLLAGLGYYHVDFGSNGSESKPAFDAGTGVSLGFGPMHLFGEARLVNVMTSGSSTRFFPVSVGFTFGM